MNTTYDEPTTADLPAVPGTRIVVFQWSTKHGECYDCGLPAAFHRASDNTTLCSVCAANAAADGEYISRIKEDA